MNLPSRRPTMTILTVGIKVVARNIHTQAARNVNSCFFTMVAVGRIARWVAAPVEPLVCVGYARVAPTRRLR